MFAIESVLRVLSYPRKQAQRLRGTHERPVVRKQKATIKNYNKRWALAR